MPIANWYSTNSDLTVLAEVEQGVLKSDPLWTSSSDVRPAVPKFRRSWKSILNLGCDIGSNFVKSHHSTVKVAYLKVTKFQPNFGKFGNYGKYGNYGNSAILLFHDFPTVKLLPQIREPLVATKGNLLDVRLVKHCLVDVKTRQTAQRQNQACKSNDHCCWVRGKDQNQIYAG